jgi:hypothetical protein
MMRDKENGAKINGDTIDTYVADRTYNTQEEHDNLLRKYQQLLDKALEYFNSSELSADMPAPGTKTITKMLDGVPILELTLGILSAEIAFVTFYGADSDDGELLSLQFNPTETPYTVADSSEFDEGIYQQVGHIQAFTSTASDLDQIDRLLDSPGSWHSPHENNGPSFGL